MDLREYEISVSCIDRNPSPASLYEDAVQFDSGAIVSSGAVVADSGEKTGRSPKDKRVVREPSSESDVWWGPVNIPLEPSSYAIHRRRAVDYLNTRRKLYVIDGFAGWDPAYRIKVRVICSRAYHALFMHNMLMRPSASELAEFGKPDYVIFNAGEFPADPDVIGGGSRTAVVLNLGAGEMVILGTQYAGEMKKGIFTVMHYLMPKRGVLSMHCSANEGEQGDVSLFFGLSGTGKTTLSADPRRQLIGDDEHCWSDNGVFNIEGGCYAKCVGLSRESEPEIYDAIRFGTVLENTVFDPESRIVDFDDTSITENTRASYPIGHIVNAKIPCVGGHPRDIILLTCDAFGVIPPVSRLTPEQMMYHFISGYTAKVAGTEVGVTEPEATFSACFGAAFLVWHPTKYAQMLAERMQAHEAQGWLVNTGWTGGGYGVGRRIELEYTRAIIDAIHSGELLRIDTVEDPVFGFAVPTKCPGVPTDLLMPRKTWSDAVAYDVAAVDLAKRFRENFQQFESEASPAIRGAAPRTTVAR